MNIGIQMKRWMIRCGLALLLGLIAVGIMAVGPFSDYFLGGMSNGRLLLVITLIKIFFLAFFSAYWLVFMSFTVPIKKKSVENGLVLLFQYGLVVCIFFIGAAMVERHYSVYSLVDRLEQSYYFLRYSLVLVVSLLPVTDFRKWTEVWELHKSIILGLWNAISKPLLAIAHRCFEIWDTLRCFCSKGKKLYIAAIAIVLSFIIVETFNMNLFFEIPWKQILWNLLFYGILYLFFWLLFRKVKFASISILICAVIIGVVNYYTILWRGNPVSFYDLTLVKTTLTVVGNYRFTIDWYFVIALFLAIWGIFLFILFQEKTKKVSALKYGIQMVIGYGIIIIFAIITIQTGFLYAHIRTESWNPRLQAIENGYLLSFMADTVSSMVTEPEGYDVEMLDSFLNESLANQKEESITEYPNIIVIMNESFSDLRVLGELETDVEYMSYINSLTEDTIYGNLYVSAFGGNTVYSEYEFLTGNSVSVLPTGAVPYIQYIHGEEVPSLAWTLKGQDTPYQAIAIHPYEKSGYNRSVAYSSLGFDDFITIDDFSDYVITRKYISDADNYQKIFDVFEEKEPGQPLFVFNITMQNHGGYGERTDYILNEPVHVTNYQVDIGVDEYLSCIKESDTAFEMLIDYFSKVEEPTIILMYGDHQPALSSSFYESIMGKAASEYTMEDELNRHKVPFVIWSNYQDYGGQYVEQISTNYLSSVLMELAGLELTDYQKYLLELREEYPVISSTGVRYVDGTWAVMRDAKSEDEHLTIYEMLQYNYLFDEEERLDSHFYPQ